MITEEKVPSIFSIFLFIAHIWYFLFDKWFIKIGVVEMKILAILIRKVELFFNILSWFSFLMIEVTNVCFRIETKINILFWHNISAKTAAFSVLFSFL